ncbi:MAG: four helix bundle protein [Bacteroidia bacterium]|jgi:four helix bundle protein
MKESVIEVKSFNFALEIIDLYRLLVEHKEFVIGQQILKSATSVGANIKEAGAGQSKRDFIAKMSIASKEARETQYWLELKDKSNLIHYDFTEVRQNALEIVKILTAIVKTSQRQLNTKH